MGIVGDIAKSLIPDPETNEPPHTFRWRQSVAIAIVLIGAMEMLHVARAFGLLTWIGISGYMTVANAEDQKQIVKQIQVAQLEEQIRKNYTDYCLAYRMQNQTAVNYLLEVVRKLRVVYAQATNSQYDLPPCNTILIQ